MRIKSKKALNSPTQSQQTTRFNTQIVINEKYMKKGKERKGKEKGKKERRKEGKKERRKEGKKERRKEGKKERRKEV
ncbi:hypothetical protein J4434_07875 [Candidatus Woesearchaeota archaeon]|nr:hypothetical protein [Candidatus Woesearchaeota archaeon]